MKRRGLVPSPSCGRSVSMATNTRLVRLRNEVACSEINRQKRVPCRRGVRDDKATFARSFVSCVVYFELSFLFYFYPKLTTNISYNRAQSFHTPSPPPLHAIQQHSKTADKDLDRPELSVHPAEAKDVSRVTTEMC